ncbi:MAG: MFS transporter [Burkholderiaceae bacterium]|nr:MFS transporter [Burkholderiaceae bacterium]MCD8516909.1 MFS transporter [Burkholderiaceae bacterium]MCD8565617.1 MFS transporter [Burkholderiaceae bacterium]
MKIFYGWKMAFAACGLQIIQSMMLHQAFGAYVAVLTTEMGWSKTSLSVGSAMLSMEAALLGPLLGWFLDRFGAKGVIKIGVLMFGLGFMGLSQIDTLTGFYLTIGVIAVGASMAGYFPLNVAVIQWFEKKRARALSVVGLGFAVGGAFVPIIAGSIELFGWRATAFGSGVVAILVGYPLANMFRRRPEDFGEVVDGIDSKSQSADKTKTASSAPEPDFTASQALRTKAFWLLAAGHAIALIVVMTVNTHAINHMRLSLGYSISQASVYIMIMTGFQVLGVLLGGYLGDKFEKRLVAAICMLLHASALFVLTFATGVIELLYFAVAHGFAWGLRGPFMQAIRADYFGRRAIGMILGVSAMVGAIGQTIGPLVAGVLGDATGDYELGFTVLSGIALIGAVVFWMAKRPLPPNSPPPPKPGNQSSSQTTGSSLAPTV